MGGGNVAWLRFVALGLGLVVLLWGNEMTPERLVWALGLIGVLLAGLQVLVGAGSRAAVSEG